MATITSLSSNQEGPSSRTAINTNFTNINNDLITAEADIVALEALQPSAAATTSLKGLTRLSVAPASASLPIAVGDNDTRMPTQGENDALAGTTGTPSTSNKFVTATDPAYTGIVLTTTDQTVAGIKTFSSIPVLPASDPTTANQAVRKSYADSLISNTTGSVVDGTATIYYAKRGNKFYYKLRIVISGDGRLPINDSATRARICTALGGTESANTAFGTGDIYQLSSISCWAQYNGSAWTTPTSTLNAGFLTSLTLA